MKEKVGLSLNFYFGEQIFLRVFANTENQDCVACTGNRLRNSGIKGWVG